MNDAESSKHLLPVVGFLKIPNDGQPYLEGARCDECEAVYTKSQSHCAQCMSRNSLRPYKLGSTGTLHTYSIVRRSFPGIEVPFISAYVDLDGGGALKGNLINVEATPEAIRFGMPVKVIFDEALGRKDREGNSYMSYFFAPA